jgi:hypothetical protein
MYIGFAFPGFDSQVFDVGKLAVVSPWQFFAIDHMSFQEADWDGKLYVIPNTAIYWFYLIHDH